MKPGDAAKLIGVGRSTFTAWTSDPNFVPFLSSGAQGGSGRPRSITDHDLRVLRFIYESRQNNISVAEISVALRQMQMNGWEGLPDIPEAPMGTANVPMMPTAAAEATLSAERKAMLREIALLQDRIEELNNELEEMEEKLTAKQQENMLLIQKLAQVETELQIYRETALTAAEAQEIIRRVAEAEVSLRLYQEGRLRPDGSFANERDELLRRLSEVETELRLYKEGKLRPEE